MYNILFTLKNTHSLSPVEGPAEPEMAPVVPIVVSIQFYECQYNDISMLHHHDNADSGRPSCFRRRG